MLKTISQFIHSFRWWITGCAVVAVAALITALIVIETVDVPMTPSIADNTDVELFSDESQSNSLSRERQIADDALIIQRSKTNAGKNFDFLADQTRSVTVHLYHSENPKPSNSVTVQGLKNFYGIPFTMYNRLNGDSLVRLVYDAQSQELQLVIPEKQFSVNGNAITTQHSFIASLGNIPVGSIVKLKGLTFLADESLNADFKLEDFETNEMEINTPVRYNVFDPDVSSFENGMWTDKAGDCSDSLSGEPIIELASSTDATAGQSALNVFSANHYACTSKTFPFEMNSENLYRFSFDYKNIQGDRVQYYYKLRGEKYTDQEGYAFSENFRAPDHKWQAFSTIIDPAVVRENFLTSEYDPRTETGGFDSETFVGDGVQSFFVGDPLKEVKYIDVFFYAPSNGSAIIENLYDNVRLAQYSLTEKRTLDLCWLVGTTAVQAADITLQPGKNTVEVVTNDVNLLDDAASFENGMWTSEAGDCSNSLPGDPLIDLEYSNDASDGNTAAKLSSQNHFACTSKTFSVAFSSQKLYILTFDYKNVKGGKAQFYYHLRSSEKQNAHSETIETKDNEWHSFETVIDPQIDGAKYIDIFLYAPSDGKQEITNLYDNVRLTEWLPKDIDSYYLYAEQKVDETPKLAAVEWKPISRWKNRVVLHGVKDSFLFSYPEEFDERWKAYVLETPTPSCISPFVKGRYVCGVPADYSVPEREKNRQADKEELKDMMSKGLISGFNGKFVTKNFDGSIRNDNLSSGWFGETLSNPTIPSELHYQVNNYGNAWWVDVAELCERQGVCRKNGDGTWEIELIVEHAFNRWFYLGLLVSGATLLGCLGYLGYDFMKRRKNNADQASNAP
jgi:hypothetical protein